MGRRAFVYSCKTNRITLFFAQQFGFDFPQTGDSAPESERESAAFELLGSPSINRMARRSMGLTRMRHVGWTALLLKVPVDEIPD
jgi:hypothetical protein